MIEEAVAGSKLVLLASLIDDETRAASNEQGHAIIGIGNVAACSRVGGLGGDDFRDADTSRLQQLDAAVEYAFRAVFDLSMVDMLMEQFAIDFEAVPLRSFVGGKSEPMGPRGRGQPWRGRVLSSRVTDFGSLYHQPTAARAAKDLEASLGIVIVVSFETVVPPFLTCNRRSGVPGLQLRIRRTRSEISSQPILPDLAPAVWATHRYRRDSLPKLLEPPA